MPEFDGRFSKQFSRRCVFASFCLFSSYACFIFKRTGNEEETLFSILCESRTCCCIFFLLIVIWVLFKRAFLVSSFFAFSVTSESLTLFISGVKRGGGERIYCKVKKVGKEEVSTKGKLRVLFALLKKMTRKAVNSVCGQRIYWIPPKTAFSPSCCRDLKSCHIQM